MMFHRKERRQNMFGIATVFLVICNAHGFKMIFTNGHGTEISESVTLQIWIALENRVNSFRYIFP